MNRQKLILGSIFTALGALAMISIYPAQAQAQVRKEKPNINRTNGPDYSKGDARIRQNARRANRELRNDRRYRRHAGQGRHRSTYRSPVNINFNIGSGFSRYRWAPSNFGLHRKNHGPLAQYKQRTRCATVYLDGYRGRRPEIVQVRRCHNPVHGYYVVRGTERAIPLPRARGRGRNR